MAGIAQSEIAQGGMETALLSMGYRLDGKLWLKPWGYMMYVYHPERNEFALVFEHAIDRSHQFWSTAIYKEGDFLEWLKRSEAHAKDSGQSGGMCGSKFEFVTREQFYAGFL